MAGFVELGIERENADEERRHRSRHLYSPEEIAVVRLGDAVIETTHPYYVDEAVSRWFRSTAHRLGRRRPRPLVAGLATFRGLDRGPCYWLRRPSKGPTSNPAHPSNPIRAIALCLGGHHVLLYRDGSGYDYHRRVPHALRDFLASRSVAVVGLGIKNDAEKLLADLGLEVARPVELLTLAAKAFGEEKVFEPKKVKGAVKMVGKGLEGLAKVVLEGMMVQKKPASVEESDYGEDVITDDQMMYAARDARLCYEIGLKGLQMTGFKT